MKQRRAKHLQQWLNRGCALCWLASACGRSELDDLARAAETGATAAFFASGGQASSGSSSPVAGGSSSKPAASGGFGAAGGFVYCPEELPVEGTSCVGSLQCAYITAEKTCCQEAATAACKQGQWRIAFTDCDCSASGGGGSIGGGIAIGGALGSGGLASAGGSGGNAGAFGCRGEPLGYVAPSCDLLIPAEPLVRLESTATVNPGALGLARATDDARCVSVATTQSGSVNEAPRLLGLSFEPWSNWPQTGLLGPLKTIELPDSTSGAFALGPSVDHRVALAFETESGGVAFGWDLDPENFRGSYRYLRSARPPLGINTSPLGEVLAAQGTLQQTMRVWNQDDTANTMFPGACADSATSVGVEPYRQGFLWATSNGSNNSEGACYYSTPTPGVATRIEIGQITDVCCAHSVWNFEFGTTITALKTAPHPNGIWIVWQATSAGSRLFRWMRIGFEPGVVLGPASVDLDGDSPSDFAVAAIGRKLAVAWRNHDDQPRLALVLIDETGSVHRSDPAVSVTDLRQLTMVSGPTGAGALLGFPDGTLMRLDCAQWE